MEKKTLRLLLAGGGSGGHIVPLLAVTQAARSLPSFEVEVLHLGSASALDKSILESSGVRSEPLAVAGLRGRNPLSMAARGLKMLLATRRALAVVDTFRPNAAFATGGYASVPVVAAARIRRVPVVLFSADVSAGLAIRLSARMAQRVAVPVAQATASLPASRTFVSGYPLRRDLLEAPEKGEAKRKLGFNPSEPLLLCFGGSHGAHTLNVALRDGLPQLLPATQILHLAGAADAPSLAQLSGDRYRVHAFLNEMPLALAAADLAVCRSGASTLGELPAVGLPAVLVPGPFAGGHQRYNAEVLTNAGGAVMLENDEVANGKLIPLLLDLLANPEKLRSMSQQMRTLARADAAEQIARVLGELAA